VSSSLLLKSPRQSFGVHSQLILEDSCKSLRGEIKGQRRRSDERNGGLGRERTISDREVDQPEGEDERTED